MAKKIIFSLVYVVVAAIVLTSCAVRPAAIADEDKRNAIDAGKPFIAQVVGLKWLNPLQRQDYPTEWQLLWTLGKVHPNKKDDMLELYPEIFSKIRFVSDISQIKKVRAILEIFINLMFQI